MTQIKQIQAEIERKNNDVGRICANCKYFDWDITWCRALSFPTRCSDNACGIFQRKYKINNTKPK